jgi:hypothetical protein
MKFQSAQTMKKTASPARTVKATPKIFDSMFLDTFLAFFEKSANQRRNDIG